MKNRHFLVALRALLFWILQCADSKETSSSNDNNDNDTIRIVGFPDGSIQGLPTQYVKSFSRWLLVESSIQGIPGASSLDTSNTSNGFVNPTSTTDLWWPVDIAKLQIRPTLDIWLHNGIPKYAAGGLDVRVPPLLLTNTNNNGRREWRNHGMNSQPLARQWTTFEGSVGNPNFRVEAFIGRSKGLPLLDGEEQQWVVLKSPSNPRDAMKRALETLGVFLSGLDDASPLSQGFHIVSIPTMEEWTDLPVMETVVDEPYTVICIGTASPDARALIDTKPDVVAKTGTSILAVTVTPTAPGGESEYLSEAYRPLYLPGTRK